MAMGKKAGRTNKVGFITLISMAVILFTAGFYYLPDKYNFPPVRKIFRGIEDLSIEWRFISRAFQSGISVQVRGAIHRNQAPGIYSKMTIFYLDDDTINYYKSYPVDRKVWAELLGHFSSSNPIYKTPHFYPPDLLLFDIFFDKPSPKPESDRFLAKAFSSFRQPAGDDFMLYTIPDFKPKLDEKNYITDKNDIIYLHKNGLSIDSPDVSNLRRFELRTSLRLQNKSIIAYYKVKSIIKKISDSLSFSGFVNIEPIEPDESVYCKCPLILPVSYYAEENGKLRLTNVYYPSIALSAVVKLTGAELSNVVLENGTVIIKHAKWKDKEDDISIPVDDHFRLFINYRATPSSGFINFLSLKNAEMAQFPRGSILLAGVAVSGISDNRWPSPMGDMYSIEHIGYTIGTILNRDFLFEIPWFAELIYLILFILLTGYLLTRGTSNAIIAILLVMIFPLLLGFVLFQFNTIIITIIPVLTGLIALVAGEIFIILTEQREKRFIKSTFSKYISPDLVNILIANPEKIELGGQGTEATVLFSDIRGFTTLSESMRPKDLIEFLNSYLTRMTNIILETKGTLDKYIGDAIVAFWGMPIDLPDHALNACRASLMMIDSLKAFNDEQVKLGNKPVDIGIGINTGNITVGNIGSEKKRNYTAIGGNVEMAEDLEDENKFYQTSIIISQFTYEKVKERAVVRELDSIYVKGDDKPIKIYELMDLA